MLFIIPLLMFVHVCKHFSTSVLLFFLSFFFHAIGSTDKWLSKFIGPPCCFDCCSLAETLGIKISHDSTSKTIPGTRSEGVSLHPYPLPKEECPLGIYQPKRFGTFTVVFSLSDSEPVWFTFTVMMMYTLFVTTN